MDEALCRHFDKLPPRVRTQLLEALSGNVPSLASSISKLGPVERSRPSLLQHRNALQQYVFLLTWLSATADQCAALEEKEGGASKATTGERTGGWVGALIKRNVGKTSGWVSMLWLAMLYSTLTSHTLAILSS